jgi:hypothetical protein
MQKGDKVLFDPPEWAIKKTHYVKEALAIQEYSGYLIVEKIACGYVFVKGITTWAFEMDWFCSYD